MVMGGALEIERAQELWNRGDLVRLLSGLALAEHQPYLAHPGADRMDGLAAARRVEAAPTRLAVDRDVLLALNLQTQYEQRSPGAKHPAERLRVERREHPKKHILRWRAMRHLQKAGQPGGARFAPQLHRLGIVAAADHRHQGGDDDSAQRVALALATAGVGQRFQRALEVGNRLLFLLLLDLLGYRET